MSKEIVTDVNKLSKGDRLEVVQNVLSPFELKVKNKKGELVINSYIFVGINNGSVTLRNIKGQLESYSINDVESGYLEKIYKWTLWRSVPNDCNALYKTNRKRIWYKKGNIKVKADCNIKNGDKFDLAEGLMICQKKYKEKIDNINQNSQERLNSVQESESAKRGLIIEEIPGNVLNAPFYYKLAFCMNTDGKVRSFLTDFLNERFNFENIFCLDDGQTYKGGTGREVFVGIDDLLCLVTSNPHEKATYNNLYESLYEMFWYCFSNDYKFIAMPKIGCGKNGLEWDKVKETIEDAYVEAYDEFKKFYYVDGEDMEESVKITVYDYSL